MTASPPRSFEQAAYLATGGLAGLSTLPIEVTWSSIFRTPQPGLWHHFRVAVPRAAARFWTFDHVKTQLTPHASRAPGKDRPASHINALIGGISGAGGGLAEILYESLVFRRRLPSLGPLANQSSKLFFCFGTYTFLSSSLNEELPPKPFWWCWIMGAAAGATGSGILGAVDGLRGRGLLAGTIKGGLTIGTVIAVQVTSCAGVLAWSVKGG